MKSRVLIIGLDGATFSVLDPLIGQGVMPFLGKFASHGVRSPLRTVVPPLTPPAWTSLMTGRSPGHHGVFDFFELESPESRHIRFVSSHDVRCETIWSMANRMDLKANVLNFPLMFPPPKLSGNVIAGWVPWRQLRLACHPEGLFDRLKKLPGFNPRELAMDIKLEEKATEGCAHEEYESWIDLHIRREQNWFEIAHHLMTETPAELTAVLFDGVDKLQHLCWRFIEGGGNGNFAEEWERRIRDQCLVYFRRLDHIIEQLCSLAGDEATVVIASDHGFGPSWEVFHINQWLAEHGYLKWRDDAHQRNLNESAILGVGQVARHTYLLDWEHTRAYATTPTSNGVYIVADRDGNSPGVPTGDYQSFRDELAHELQDFRDPKTGEPVVQRIWTREEAFAGPCMERAPDLTLALRDGGLVSILPTNGLLHSRPEVAGSHRPRGVFLAKGPGIVRNQKATELSILDVAPIVLYALGMRVPEDLEGRVPEEVFEPDELERRPVRRGSPTQPPPCSLSGPQPVSDLEPEDEAILAEQLRKLGYLG